MSTCFVGKKGAQVCRTSAWETKKVKAFYQDKWYVMCAVRCLSSILAGGVKLKKLTKNKKIIIGT